jgi:glycosyltransferase involved in cell wall biosynthesis
MNKLSVVFITFNEEKNIERSLVSVREIADEIVVVDSFSTDATKEICVNYGVRFIEHEFRGYVEQKNFAASQATYDLVLSLDADEVPDAKLIESISSVKSNWQFDGYFMNRLNNYCGTWIRHGTWYPNRKLRLWNRKKGKWAGFNPHDRFELVDGSSTGYLKGDLLHYS